jgi:hypothetical protein
MRNDTTQATVEKPESACSLGVNLPAILGATVISGVALTISLKEIVRGIGSIVISSMKTRWTASKKGQE